MTEHVDSELVARVLTGDTSAFDALILRYQKPLFNSCLRMVGNREDARDIVQTVFLKAYEKLDTFDRERRFFSWIFRMMMNESLNLMDRRRPTQELAPSLAAPGFSPEETLLQDERHARIQDALMRLQPDYRAAVVLRYFGDLSYRELAYVLDISEKTVKSRLFSARRRLADWLAGQGMATHDQ